MPLIGVCPWRQEPGDASSSSSVTRPKALFFHFHFPDVSSFFHVNKLDGSIGGVLR